jgi:copper transport protein
VRKRKSPGTWFDKPASVVNAKDSVASITSNTDTHVDRSDAHVASADTKEMDITLKLHLPPAVYAVLWRTQSAEDGHILRGSFLFTVAAPNGMVPTLTELFLGRARPQAALPGNSMSQRLSASS